MTSKDHFPWLCTIFYFYIITSIRNIKFSQLQAVHPIYCITLTKMDCQLYSFNLTVKDSKNDCHSAKILHELLAEFHDFPWPQSLDFPGLENSFLKWMNEFVFAPSYRDLSRGSTICLLIQFSFKSTTETSECKAHVAWLSRMRGNAANNWMSTVFLVVVIVVAVETFLATWVVAAVVVSVTAAMRTTSPAWFITLHWIAPASHC